jgi:NADH-quinone oxidoreductase subunit L
MFFLSHIWLIPLLPAFGATVMFFFGRKLQKATVSAVCVGTIVLAFLMACAAVWQYSAWSSTSEHFHQPYQTILYTWLGTDTGHTNYASHGGTPALFHADAGFLLDPLSSIWLLFVTGVGMLIHIYSTGYMAHEGGLLPLLRLPQPLHVLHAHADPGQQLCAHVCWLGRRGAVFVSADRLLFPPEVGY